MIIASPWNRNAYANLRVLFVSFCLWSSVFYVHDAVLDPYTQPFPIWIWHLQFKAVHPSVRIPQCRVNCASEGTPTDFVNTAQYPLVWGFLETKISVDMYLCFSFHKQVSSLNQRAVGNQMCPKPKQQHGDLTRAKALDLIDLVMSKLCHLLTGCDSWTRLWTLSGPVGTCVFDTKWDR